MGKQVKHKCSDMQSNIVPFYCKNKVVKVLLQIKQEGRKYYGGTADDVHQYQ